ncbi:unnamed protein product, partial [Rotaria sordida]
IWDDKIFFSDLNLYIIYYQYKIEFPKIQSQIINGYINFDENFLTINLGQLFIENHSIYQFISFNLISNKFFFLKQLSNNQTELYFKSFHQTSSIEYQIHLTIMAIKESIPGITFHNNNNNTKIFFPSTEKFQTINIHLWPIYRQMLEQTISLIININPNITYEQFIIYNLPIVRQTLAQIIDVNIQYVHIYTYELKQNHIELLIAILHSTSQRYIHKEILYNKLKNSTNIFDKILFNQCQSNSCENNGNCTSYISLLYNQYKYIYYNIYQRLIPKYQWNIKCLCKNYYYGERCQFKYTKQSPCLSNPCSSMEKCIEENSTLYSCQCIDKLCNYNNILKENSFQCININSPTCRDSSNTLTFNGYSLIRMNITMNMIQQIKITLSFRTQSIEGKLFKLIYFNEKIKIILQIIDGYINMKFNEKILLQLNQTLINDGLWHDIYFSIDYIHNYYLLRLDHIFSNKIILLKQIHSNNLKQLIIGSDFKGCLGNLTLNNQMIFLQQQKYNNNNNNSIEFIDTNNGCLLSEIIQEYPNNDDFCSLYHPCYHGGICINHGLNFTCNCSKPRFTGHQCQLDLYPCESYPCQFHEKCIPLLSNSNQLFTCVILLESLSISIKKYLYIGLIIPLFIYILLILIIYYRQKRKENFIKTKSFVSAPLLIHKRSSITDRIENPRQTLHKLNYNGKPTIETITFADNNHKNSIINYLNNRNNHQAYKSLNRRSNNSKYYATTEQMPIRSDDFLVHDNSTGYDNTYIPLTTELFDFSLSPTQYFNIHKTHNHINYQIRLNSLSDLTENDLDLTESSNTSSITNRDRKYSCHTNHKNISTSISSLPKVPIYARIVKTPRVTNTTINTTERNRLSSSFTSAATSLLQPIENDGIETNESTMKVIPINHLRQTSDSNVQNNSKKSNKLSSFFQTDV